MDENILREAGHRLYITSRLKEMKRYLVFRARCRMHKDIIEDLLAFFAETELRKNMLKGTPAFVEQVTRAFFYKDSDYADRAALIKNHVLFMEKHFSQETVSRLYAEVNEEINAGKSVTLWEDVFEDKPLCLNLWFNAGQRKEGCLSLILQWDKEPLYQIMFWFGPDMEKTGNAIWIGAMQGTTNGSDIIKRLTKAFFGYRPKNLIFYGIRNLARCLGLQKIYAVTNEGYYAMNHVRSDRKLKTDFAEFWQECEGQPCAGDSRFFVIPVAEHRKDMSELKPSKRAQHRRRFEKMDAIDKAFDESCKTVLRSRDL
ncbi:MAG: DUF535 domain-containing protein [Acidaminococcaceae bacterium]|nr:DUF535 domain-containing protein [Acidaminococcaceae bacterium]MBR1591243.1 DUF535 domain-containing protein [Acidaminococcaceae bacterium]